MERIKMVMTRGKDDPETLYNLLGTKEIVKNWIANLKMKNPILKLLL